MFSKSFSQRPLCSRTSFNLKSGAWRWARWGLCRSTPFPFCFQGHWKLMVELCGVGRAARAPESKQRIVFECVGCESSALQGCPPLQIKYSSAVLSRRGVQPLARNHSPSQPCFFCLRYRAASSANSNLPHNAANIMSCVLTWNVWQWHKKARVACNYTCV